MTLTGEQLTAVRELIGLSQLELAVLLQVGLRTIAEFEAGKQTLSEEAVGALRRALEAAGVRFANYRPFAELRSRGGIIPTTSSAQRTTKE